MTQDELAGIEEIIARAKRSNGMAPAYDLATIHADALVAEVRKLRGLVEAAYSEGWHNGFAHERDEVLPYVRPEAETAWEKSDACREMEGA